MKYLSQQYSAENRNHLSSFLILTMLCIFIAKISLSCTGSGDQELNEYKCELRFLQSELPADSLNIQYINDHHTTLTWSLLNESEYAQFNQKHELWYRMIPQLKKSARPMLILMAYTKGFEVFSGKNSIYSYPENDKTIHLKTHVIPLPTGDQPVFIRFRYKNFNDALLKDVPYVMPEKLVTSMIFDQKLNPFSRDFGLVFPGTTFVVLSFISLFLYLKRRKKEYHLFLYFGLFSFMTGLLYLLPLTRLPWINMMPHVYWTVEHIIVKLIVIFFVVLSAYIFNAGKNVIFRMLIIILAVMAITDLPLFMFYPLPFHVTIVMSFVVLIFIVTSVIAGYRSTRKAPLIKKLIFYSMILMYLLALGDMLISLFLPPTDIVLFGFGIVVYVFAMIYYLENEYIKNQNKHRYTLQNLNSVKMKISV